MDFLNKAWDFIRHYALLIGGFFKNAACKTRELWQNFRESGFAQTTGSALKQTGKVLALTAKWAYRLRGVLLSIPVMVAALALAARNTRLLPEEVGLNIMTNGEYQWMISREIAVWAPVCITAACRVMVILSRKTLYPWMISLFSLVLPLLLWFTNIFPA